MQYLDKNNLHEPMQSACRKFHSTETALLKVQNDILLALDNQHCVLLTLLDLSAAFDTVDHSVLLDRLSNSFGIKDEALSWITSYLSNRKKCVVINGVSSDDHSSNYDVPQGSVLGPDLFKKYGSPLAKLIRSFGIDAHLYADDTQLYIMFKTASQVSSVKNMEACVGAVRAWLANNYLKLNDNKTEVIVLGSSTELAKLSPIKLCVGDEKISPSASVRNIGAVFDSSMKLNEQVTAQCKSAWFNIHRIGKIRKYLNKNQSQVLVHSLVTSRIDHHNSLLHGLPKTQISRLQRVQNASARLITKCPKQDHITPILQELHWLPVSERIVFKILVLTYKSLHGEGPSYLSDMLKWYNPSRSLRSSSCLLLVIPHVRLATYGARAFSFTAPHLWNSLPLNIRQSKDTSSFRKALKTHLFIEFYKC